MSSFKVDPDFLKKINENMVMNEQINAHKGRPKEPAPQEKERSQVYMEGLRF